MSASDYQIDINGTVIGDGTAYEIVSVSGFEEFTTRGTDVPFPVGWGNIPGSSFVEAKVALLAVESVNPPDILTLEAALLAPQMAAPDVLIPVRYKYPMLEERLVYGRVGRRQTSRDQASSVGLTRLTFEIELPDPRSYSAVLQQAALTVFVAGSAGLDFTLDATTNLGIDFTLDATTNLGIDLVGTSSSGLQIVTNLGSIATYPLIVVSPATGISGFVLTNQTTGQVFTVNQTLNPGQTLIADMKAAATGVGAGGLAVAPITVAGTSVYGSWLSPRVPLVLNPGQNILRFDVTGDTAATALVTAASAYL